MICNKCNAEIPDDSKICPMCGVPVNEAAPAAEPVAEPVAPAAEPVAPAAEPVAQPAPAVSFEPVAEPPKKKSKALKVLLGVGIPVVAIILAVCLLLPSLFPGGVLRAFKGFAVKTFGDNNDYFRYVEAEQFGDYADTVTTVYGRITDTFKNKDNTSAKSNVNIKLGDKAFDLLTTYADVPGSYINWFESADIALDVNSKDGNASIEAALKLNGKDVISGNLSISEDGDIFAQVPELNEQYIYIDGATSGLGGSSSGDVTGAVSGQSVLGNIANMDLDEYLPDADKLNALLKKYIKLATECVDDVESETATLEAGDVENDYTALIVDFDEELLCKIALAALEEAENDKEIKEMLEQICGLMNEADAGVDSDDVYDEFLAAVDMGAGEVESYLASLDGDGEVFFRLIDYVDSSSTIVGRAIQVPMNIEGIDGVFTNVFSYHEVTDGSDYGMFMGFYGDNDGLVFIEGTGKKNGNKVSITDGDLSIMGGGMELALLTFTTKDLNTADMEDAFFNGTITLAPADGFWKLVFGGDLEDVEPSDRPVWIGTVMDLKLEITGKGNNADNADLTLSLFVQDDMVIALNVTGKQAGGSKVSFPNEDDCAWIGNDEDGEEWLGDIDTEKILDNIDAAGVPGDILDMIEQILPGGGNKDFGGGDVVAAPVY